MLLTKLSMILVAYSNHSQWWKINLSIVVTVCSSAFIFYYCWYTILRNEIPDLMAVYFYALVYLIVFGDPDSRMFLHMG